MQDSKVQLNVENLQIFAMSANQEMKFPRKVDRSLVLVVAQKYVPVLEMIQLLYQVCFHKALFQRNHPAKGLLDYYFFKVFWTPWIPFRIIRTV